MIEEERIRRSLVDQVRTLGAENQRLQNIINQRSVNVAVEAVEGLGVLVNQAKAGEPNSLEVLKLLAQRLEEVRTLGAGIVLPNGSSPG